MSEIGPQIPAHLLVKKSNLSKTESNQLSSKSPSSSHIHENDEPEIGSFLPSSISTNSETATPATTPFKFNSQLPPSKPIIGPTLPPSLTQQTGNQCSTEPKPDESDSDDDIIGPTLPPVLSKEEVTIIIKRNVYLFLKITCKKKASYYFLFFFLILFSAFSNIALFLHLPLYIARKIRFISSNGRY